MSEKHAVKHFKISEGSTSGAWYRITVTDARTGKKVDEFITPTMLEAYSALERAGYEIVLKESVPLPGKLRGRSTLI